MYQIRCTLTGDEAYAEDAGAALVAAHTLVLDFCGEEEPNGDPFYAPLFQKATESVEIRDEDGTLLTTLTGMARAGILPCHVKAAFAKLLAAAEEA